LQKLCKDIINLHDNLCVSHYQPILMLSVDSGLILCSKILKNDKSTISGGYSTRISCLQVPIMYGSPVI